MGLLQHGNLSVSSIATKKIGLCEVLLPIKTVTKQEKCHRLNILVNKHIHVILYFWQRFIRKETQDVCKLVMKVMNPCLMSTFQLLECTLVRYDAF